MVPGSQENYPTDRKKKQQKNDRYYFMLILPIVEHKKRNGVWLVSFRKWFRK